jgi:formylglycine-generating enzyme required for sulfatase activity
MYGNAWECVQDWYDSKYYAQNASTDPKGPASGQYRVLRGGSSFSDPKTVRVSMRHFIGAPATTDYYGVRPVREAIQR